MKEENRELVEIAFWTVLIVGIVKLALVLV